eukprot:CAMPEP_0176367134 /NCGR_PEP_ID=MMETSP0126-20121128/21661_1 /TAXON_ID=141414 ORGANISM="Strombidinopsis acuminatum, Strain SPMC142" /NCGR_SAMPLE_ID=MMETSP0126 /ASSEMBLY_ACC=CAM_ASM_000229 /LENGTH=110 /DNA_ID=CAMNT_0017724821 /DNA_START=21 /DNA_END=353 /DNA_ORIENTATION=-
MNDQELAGFMDDAAIDAFCEGVDKAFDQMKLAMEAKGEVLEEFFSPNSTKEQREHFLFNLMDNDDLVNIGLFGPEFHKVFKEGTFDNMSREQLVKLLLTSRFAGVAYTDK